MSLTLLPLSAQITAAPRDHSWYQVDDTIPFYAQAVQNIGQFQIPPFKYTALTNDGDGNPTYIEFKDTGPSGTVVAALSCTYENKFVTSVFQVI